jgi:hypothetical protein
MKRSTFFVLRAVIALAYALLALIVPGWLSIAIRYRC